MKVNYLIQDEFPKLKNKYPEIMHICSKAYSFLEIVRAYENNEIDAEAAMGLIKISVFEGYTSKELRRKAAAISIMLFSAMCDEKAEDKTSTPLDDWTKDL